MGRLWEISQEVKLGVLWQSMIEGANAESRKVWDLNIFNYKKSAQYLRPLVVNSHTMVKMVLCSHLTASSPLRASRVQLAAQIGVSLGSWFLEDLGCHVALSSRLCCRLLSNARILQEQVKCHMLITDALSLL